MTQQYRRCPSAPASIFTSIAISAATLPAFAQDPAPQDRANASLEEITVTGTRIRRDDFSTPTPTTVVDSQYMENLGIVNVADMVTQIPSNVSNFQPQKPAAARFSSARRSRICAA